MVPPTEPDEPFWQVQVHLQEQSCAASLALPTEPEQQGLQQELATKLGNTMPP